MLKSMPLDIERKREQASKKRRWTRTKGGGGRSDGGVPAKEEAACQPNDCNGSESKAIELNSKEGGKQPASKEEGQSLKRARCGRWRFHASVSLIDDQTDRRKQITFNGVTIAPLSFTRSRSPVQLDTSPHLDLQVSTHSLPLASSKLQVGVPYILGFRGLLRRDVQDVSDLLKPQPYLGPWPLSRMKTTSIGVNGSKRSHSRSTRTHYLHPTDLTLSSIFLLRQVHGEGISDRRDGVVGTASRGRYATLIGVDADYSTAYTLWLRVVYFGRRTANPAKSRFDSDVTPPSRTLPLDEGQPVGTAQSLYRMYRERTVPRVRLVAVGIVFARHRDGERGKQHVLTSMPSPARRAERDDVYYWDTVRFLVEETIFKLPRYQFIVGSEYFAKTYLQNTCPPTPQFNDNLDPDDDWDSMDVTDAPRLRISTAGAVELEGVTAEEFRVFLKLLFPIYSTSTELKFSKPEWLTILTLSTHWHFLEFRKLAIEHLDADMTTQDGYEKLVTKKDVISEEESEAIGYKTAVRLYIVRHELARILQDGKDGCTKLACAVVDECDCLVTNVEKKFEKELQALMIEEQSRMTKEDLNATAVERARASVELDGTSPAPVVGDGLDTKARKAHRKKDRHAKRAAQAAAEQANRQEETSQQPDLNEESSTVGCEDGRPVAAEEKKEAHRQPELGGEGSKSVVQGRALANEVGGRAYGDERPAASIPQSRRFPSLDSQLASWGMDSRHSWAWRTHRVLRSLSSTILGLISIAAFAVLLGLWVQVISYHEYPSLLHPSYGYSTGTNHGIASTTSPLFLPASSAAPR
ncbi:hypothetical protein NMY22_g9087 [Coprinellus aureogranulatus]|nr:hypothetical protein NMY22_g9087 [Coprinellus aureogranulatus]